MLYMTIETKIRKIGNSYGMILSKEVLQELNVEEGATVYITESSGNSVKLTSAKPDFKAMMDIVDQGIKEYPNALSELAK
jgi:putative addiction module antidote